MEDGKVTRTAGDPDSPFNKGAMCPIGAASLEYLNSPDRLTHPLQRAGERGEGKWQQISWDEALNVVAGELAKARDNYGAESVVVIRSAARGLPDDYILRFANAFGTPNFSSPWHVCHTPTAGASIVTYGAEHVPDYQNPPACIVFWGRNIKKTATPNYVSAKPTLDKGVKLIVIDPVEIDFAKKADIWLQVRPGSDLALALGIINVIVNEELYDRDFVDNWTVGFEQLKVHIQDYPPEKVADITWVDAEKIREAARFYATNRPACIEHGNAIEHNVNSFQAARAICILQAITGNLEVPGGDIELATSPGLIARGSPEFTLSDKIPRDMRKQQWISSETGMLPMVSAAIPQDIVRSILEGDPYPIRAAYIQGSNVLLTWSNAQDTYEALKMLDFIVVADMFMTPTAAMADVVLPVASYLEYNNIGMFPGHQVARIQQKVAQIGECWSDYKIVGELAKRLGLAEYFWNDEEQFLDDVLKPTETTFSELRKIGIMPISPQPYKRYETNGFKTPSGKVELYSNRLKKWGFDPLPVYHEQPETPYSDPELAKEYPLILTSSKAAHYRHSSGRHISSLRNSHPDPVVEIHPETASQLGIKEGDWVYIETKRGKIKQKAKLSTRVDPRVVYVDYAWWLPEKGSDGLYGWADSNINILTDNKTPNNPEMGSSNLRGFLCKVYKIP